MYKCELDIQHYYHEDENEEPTSDFNDFCFNRSDAL